MTAFAWEELIGMRGRLPVLAALTAGLLLAGCGGGDKKASDEGSPGPSASPSAEPLSGTFSGGFHNVDNPPEGTGDITGTAKMEVDDDRTKVSVDVQGLAGKAVYVAHVHNDACAAADPGGAHYKFDPNGGDMPPNEIHLTLDNKDGHGTAEAQNDDQATSSARSVVIHLKRSAEDRKSVV